MTSFLCHLATIQLKHFLAVILVILVLQHDAICAREELVVNTDKGRVKGVRYYMPSIGKVVEAYLGIPFAQPPLGHLRFRLPQPIDRWQGIYNATSLPNSCYQTPDTVFGDFYGSTMWNPTTKISEDCLYLNVWVPKKHPRIRKSAVLVWIFGGGFFSGTTTLNLYDGKILASVNDIIVVSIGYRVGPLGFLSLDHPEAPGNAGMFDQLMALDWVQKNIKHFGGDPNNVTLFGESAGSVSVSLHLLSPLSRSKFHRAILQSGSANMPWAVHSKEESKNRALTMAELLNCPADGTDIGDTVYCLRSKSAQEIILEQWVSRGIAQFPFVPIIDGIFLVESPEKSLKRKSFKKCPIIAGSNLNEGAFFVIYELYPDYLSLDHVKLNREEFLHSVRTLFYHYPQYPKKTTSIGIEAIAFQYSNWLDPNDKYSNAIALDNAIGDAHFTCNMNLFANAYAEAGENVYYYYFTERYKSNPWPEWMGVLHGDEILFAFGEPLKMGLNFTLAEQQLTRKIMGYWTNFAKTGDPNRHPADEHYNEEWPKHRPRELKYLELNSKFLNNPSAGVARGPRAAECAFWLQYLPQLLAASEHMEEQESSQTTTQHMNLPVPYPTTNFTALQCGSHYAGASTQSAMRGLWLLTCIVVILHRLAY